MERASKHCQDSALVASYTSADSEKKLMSLEAVPVVRFGEQRMCVVQLEQAEMPAGAHSCAMPTNQEFQRREGIQAVSLGVRNALPACGGRLCVCLWSCVLRCMSCCLLNSVTTRVFLQA